MQAYERSDMLPTVCPLSFLTVTHQSGAPWGASAVKQSQYDTVSDGFHSVHRLAACR